MDTPTINNTSQVNSKKTLLIIILIVAFVGIGLVAIWLLSTLSTDENREAQVSPTPTTQISATNTPAVEARNTWAFDGNKWSSAGSSPQCPEPLTIVSPANVDIATNILYPGQVRSGDFKPHGGFRFDENSDNKVTVTLPLDAILYRGSRYIEAGEVQYMLDFITPCGIMFRFDHLLVLSPRLATLVETLPAAEDDNSRTTNFSGTDFFTAGEEIALEVGFKNTKNVAFDFGMYDLREQNTISKSSSWASQYQSKKETAYYGLCWLEYLSSPDKEAVLALPGSGTEGKVSDYCQ